MTSALAEEWKACGEAARQQDSVNSAGSSLPWTEPRALDEQEATALLAQSLAAGHGGAGAWGGRGPLGSTALASSGVEMPPPPPKDLMAAARRDLFSEMFAGPGLDPIAAVFDDEGGEDPLEGILALVDDVQGEGGLAPQGRAGWAALAPPAARAPAPAPPTYAHPHPQGTAHEGRAQPQRNGRRRALSASPAAEAAQPGRPAKRGRASGSPPKARRQAQAASTTSAAEMPPPPPVRPPAAVAGAPRLQQAPPAKAPPPPRHVILVDWVVEGEEGEGEEAMAGFTQGTGGASWQSAARLQYLDLQGGHHPAAVAAFADPVAPLVFHHSLPTPGFPMDPVPSALAATLYPPVGVYMQMHSCRAQAGEGVDPAPAPAFACHTPGFYPGSAVGGGFGGGSSGGPVGMGTGMGALNFASAPLGSHLSLGSFVGGPHPSSAHPTPVPRGPRMSSAGLGAAGVGAGPRLSLTGAAGGAGGGVALPPLAPRPDTKSIIPVPAGLAPIRVPRQSVFASDDMLAGSGAGGSAGGRRRSYLGTSPGKTPAEVLQSGPEPSIEAMEMFQDMPLTPFMAQLLSEIGTAEQNYAALHSGARLPTDTDAEVFTALDDFLRDVSSTANSGSEYSDGPGGPVLAVSQP